MVGVTLLHSLSVFKDLEVLNRALFGEEYNFSKVCCSSSALQISR
jgi:hypothetical protein